MPNRWSLRCLNDGQFTRRLLDKADPDNEEDLYQREEGLTDWHWCPTGWYRRDDGRFATPSTGRWSKWQR